MTILERIGRWIKKLCRAAGGEQATGITTSAAAGQPLTLDKPAILRRMDRLAQDRAVMEAALRDLQREPPLPMLELGIRHQYVTSAEGEADHLRYDWFDAVAGWWQYLPAIEPVLRAAFIKAGELMLEHNLPVDCYWIQGGGEFQVAITKSDHQITLLFMSPNSPGRGGAKVVPSRNPDIWMMRAETVAAGIGR